MMLPSRTTSSLSDSTCFPEATPPHERRWTCTHHRAAKPLPADMFGRPGKGNDKGNVEGVLVTQNPKTKPF